MWRASVLSVGAGVRLSLHCVSSALLMSLTLKTASRSSVVVSCQALASVVPYKRRHASGSCAHVARPLVDTTSGPFVARPL